MRNLGIVFVIIAIVCAFVGWSNTDPARSSDDGPSWQSLAPQAGISASSADVMDRAVERNREWREQRHTKATWFWVSAAVLGIVGSICIASTLKPRYDKNSEQKII